jgi:predicted heme/steroid binding protein
MKIPDRIVTLSELHRNTGARGMRKFIVHNGIVYGVTGCPKWMDDQHESKHFPGQDLTGELIEAPHQEEVFHRPCARIMGRFVENLHNTFCIIQCPPHRQPSIVGKKHPPGAGSLPCAGGYSVKRILVTFPVPSTAAERFIFAQIPASGLSWPIRGHSIKCTAIRNEVNKSS